MAGELCEEAAAQVMLLHYIGGAQDPDLAKLIDEEVGPTPAAREQTV